MVLLFQTSMSTADDIPANELQGWYFSIEQDLFYLFDPDKNEDRYYTIGIDVGFFGEAATHTYAFSSK